jgi:hypothetical protein
VSDYKTDEVLGFTRRIVDLLASRLILCFSDEISQVGGIEKLEVITELMDEMWGLAE